MRYYADPVLTGKKIRQLCMEHEVSVVQLSEALDISQQSVYKWLRGENMPDIDNIIGITQFFHVDYDTVIGYISRE